MLKLKSVVLLFAILFIPLSSQAQNSGPSPAALKVKALLKGHAIHRITKIDDEGSGAWAFSVACDTGEGLIPTNEENEEGCTSGDCCCENLGGHGYYQGGEYYEC